MIKLRFVSSTGFFSDVVRRGEMGFWASHVEAVVDGGYLGALGDGVKLRPAGYDAGQWSRQLFVEVAATDAQTAVFNAFLKSKIGTPYDWAAIDAMAAGEITGDEETPPPSDDLICSALQHAALVAAGVLRRPPQSVRLTTPRDLLYMCSALTDVGSPEPAPRRFRLGRNRPAQRARLVLDRYLTAGAPLPTPPAVEHWTRGNPALFQILGNDRLGDCTSAGAGHILDALRVNAGNLDRAVTEADALAFYSKSTGYDPANPASDQGGDEITVLNCWRDHGYFADGSGAIAAYASVDGGNVAQVKSAIWLMENVYFGVEMPDAWVNPEPIGNGFVWDVAGDPVASNGHCFVGLGYNAIGVIIDTWGMLGTITWAAVKKYATPAAQGELYTVFSRDQIARASAKAPNGFDAATLAADIARL